MLGALLHQRGFLVLHAAAVALEDGVVAILGDPGMGKSTLAGAFVQAGYTFTCVDIVAIAVLAGRPVVQPGAACLRLCPDAAQVLGAESLAPLKVGPDEKIRLPLAAAIAGALRRLYVLADGEYVGIEPLPPRDAFMTLVRFTYALRWIAGTGTAGRQAQQCAALVSAVPVSRLIRPRVHASLQTAVQAVVDDTVVWPATAAFRGQHVNRRLLQVK
jgi:hypothetical protein